MSDNTTMINDQQFFEQFDYQPRPEFAEALRERLQMEEGIDQVLTVTAVERAHTTSTAITAPDQKSWANSLSIVEAILRTREEFFAEIREGLGLRHKILAMMISSASFLGIYGGVMGAASQAYAVPQMLSSAVKLPVLFLITLIICTPSLYFFNLLFGSRQTILQNIALIMTAVTTTAVLLVSLAPVTLFFLTTGGDYEFFKLLNVAIFGVSGLMGVSFLRQGFAASVDASNPEGRRARRALFLAWVVLYAFVGMQMAWTLRPFIGSPAREFELIRQNSTSNFYENVFDSARLFLSGD